jgi:hypothetical protein
MDLFTIQNTLIASSSADAWFRLAAAGTSFDYQWAFGTGPDGNWSYVADEHRQHAVCREEPSLTMSWGLRADDEDDRHFDWAQDFVNKTVRVYWVDFFWNKALIDRVELCSIDGGHGTIPLPDYGKTVTHFEVSVAQLVHDLSGGPDSDGPGGYLDGLDFAQISDVERRGAGSRS